MSTYKISKNFFEKLKEVAINIEEQVRDIEAEFSKAKRDLPDHLSILAVDKIAEEQDTINKSVEATHAELQKCVEAGDNTILYATSVLKELEEGIGSVETYLGQFGFKPLQDMERKEIINSTSHDNCIENSKVPNVMVERCEPKKETSVFDNFAFKESQLQRTLFTCATPQVYIPQGIRKDYLPFTPLRTPECFQREVTLTPGLFQNKSVKTQESTSSTHAASSDEKFPTPEEPVLLSAQKTKSQEKFPTPEEPVLPSAQKTSQEIKTTPEIPIWRSACKSKSQKKLPTPEEPILLSTQKTKSQTWKIIPEEAVLPSTQKSDIEDWKLLPKKSVLKNCEKENKTIRQKLDFQYTLTATPEVPTFQTYLKKM